ncbi:hypothetical protein [Halobacillus litoralis]|uniref:Sporulation protein n=1 Tax=Halobacillus litoralis TaxID=45668 RepID=A0A410MEY8_9BACI|nr:hypothetical protein [Halobacillus litoralis]QAS53291.1 hypothetical protein HLI_14375 [Halobacillus litoralis]
MFRFILMLAVSLMLMTACGLQMENYQGQTSRDDVENMGMNNEATEETENPRSISKVGDTWGMKQDRELIKESAQELPGVEVKRVILEANKVWVTVDIAGEDEMSEKEKEEWKAQVEEAIYQAVPSYDIQVKIK